MTARLILDLLGAAPLAVALVVLAAPLRRGRPAGPGPETTAVLPRPRPGDQPTAPLMVRLAATPGTWAWWMSRRRARLDGQAAVLDALLDGPQGVMQT